MRPILFSLLMFFALQVAAGEVSDGGSTAIKYNGYYRTEKVLLGVKAATIAGREIDGASSYLRFYPDGTVVLASIGSAPNAQPDAVEISNWLNKANTNIMRGRFTISGRAIAFDVSSLAGTIRFHGDLLDDRPVFHVKSQINQKEANEQYWFVALDR